MPLDYSLGKLASAVNTLANGKGRIRDRLQDAAAEELVEVRPVDLPDDARKVFDDAMRALTSIRGNGGKSSIAASLGAMTEDEAQAVANNILSAYSLAQSAARDSS